MPGGAPVWLAVALAARAAGPGLALPPSEDPAAWAEATDAVPLPGNVSVRLLDGAQQWRIVVETPAGRVERALPAPRTAADRIDVLVLAASLAAGGGGLGWGDLAPIAPPRPSRPPEPAGPRPLPVPEVPSATAPLPPEPSELLLVEPPLVEPPPPPEPPLEPAGPITPAEVQAVGEIEQPSRGLRLSPVGAVRVVHGGTFAPWLGGGAWASGRRWRFEALGGATPAVRVAGVREPARVQRVELRASPAVRLGALAVGAVGGLSVRSYRDGDLHIGTIAVPELGGSASWTLPLRSPLAITPHAGAVYDLRLTQIAIGDVVTDLPRIGIEAGLTVGLGTEAPWAR